MPTYVYRCKACLKEFEELQSFSEKPLVKCPSCKKNKLVRVIGGSSLVFKGSGFYLTDYKKKSIPESEPKQPPKKETKGEGKTDTQSENKSDAKGESSGETKSETQQESKSESKNSDSSSSKKKSKPSSSK